MNCPSRPDRVEGHPDWNQSPHDLNSDATTRADLNGIVNLREERQAESSPDCTLEISTPPIISTVDENGSKKQAEATTRPVQPLLTDEDEQSPSQHGGRNLGRRVRGILFKYAQFIGPGFLISVSYQDPGNFSVDVDAGATTRYSHLFVILMSNLFAIFLQSLCIKLGSVTGLNLAENCRKHLPKWLNIVLYILAESAIIATDVAEVIGTAIALNLLIHVPLIAGCALSLLDVLILLIFYRPDGSMARLRLFEYLVMALVLGVMVCFCIQLSYIRDTSVREVFRGYIPSGAVVEGSGIYLSCGILGATVMPHSIFLGSGIVQSRLRHFDEQHGSAQVTQLGREEKYRPSLQAIRSCLKYSIVELATSLFSFALFVNSAILIVAGSSLYPKTDDTDADLFGIYDLLCQNLSKVAGTIFALALLLSGISAGIIVTLAGQQVSEGMLQWKLKPWIRRLITRMISIIPSIAIAAAVGKDGLSEALTASQVVLSVILPFVTAPLLWFTCKSNIMTVRASGNSATGSGEVVNMRNGWIVMTIAILIWLVLVVMNVSLLVLVALGKA